MQKLILSRVHCTLLVVLCQVSLCGAQSTASSTTISTDSFNFEIAKRIHDNIKFELHKPKFPCLQTAHAVRAGTFNLTLQFQQSIQQLEFSQITTVDTSVAQLYVGSEEGMFLSYFAYNSTFGFYQYTQVDNGSAFCAASPTSHPCRRYYTTDVSGIQQSIIGYKSYDPRIRPWYTDCKNKAINGSVWSSVYTFATSGKLGITFGVQIFDKFGSFVGVAASDMELGALDSFLYSEYHDESDHRLVYIKDKNGYLIASSDVGASVVWVANQPFQVKANQSENIMIRTSTIFLDVVLKQYPDRLFIHNGFYIQSSSYIDEHSGIDWQVVVMRPAQKQNDFVAYASTSFTAIAVVAVIVSIITIAILLWVYRFRDLQIWKAAQPDSLYLILFSNLMCVSTTFVVAGPPKDHLCVLRQWWISLSLTLTCTSLIVKIFRVLVMFAASQKFTRISFSGIQFLATISAVLCVQILSLVVWTALDPMKPQTEFTERSGQVFQSTLCKSHHIWGFSLVASLLGILLIIGCVVSYRSRNLSELFTESRALMAIFYHGAFITILITTASFVANVSTSELDVFISIGMCWFTASTQAGLFLPRIMRQMTQGDFSTEEIKDIARQNLKKIISSSRTQSPSVRTTPVATPDVQFVI
eukprot:c11871_g1_i1.p1 GENE.c11871_g1_i1~~c11871_g1_i1.p1  ORF type:complete len:642 (+),score=115.52 c11871_g1_i1:284-2209(+)